MPLRELAMALSRYKLGELIELRDERNSDGKFTLEDVRGVNNLKSLMPTKADMNGRDLSKFQIVQSGEFVFNHRTSRNGSKFSIACNNEDFSVICTEDYVVFRIKEEARTILMNEWLYMFFNRSEFDRYVITNSWGSSTEFYNWEDICSIDILLPDLATQQKYVDIYKAMVANQQSYERGLEDLKLVCDAYIEDLRRKMPCEKIGKYIYQQNERNSDKVIEFVI
jgi:type I restriction enzyme S subunit